VHVAIDARLADYSPGGIGRYSLQLARALAGMDLSERFTLLRAARPRIAADVTTQMDQARLFTPPHHPFEQLTLPLELLRLHADLLHSTDFIPPQRRRCKSVVTVHDLGFLLCPETLTGPSRRYYGQIRSAVRSADRIIAVSRCTRDDLERLVGAEPSKIDVVLEAPDPRFGPVESREALASARRRLGVSRPYVLFVGTFEPRKNLVTLLDAFGHVRRQIDVQLALVGHRGWHYEPVFRHLRKLGLEPHVKIVQGIPNAELPPVYSGAAVLAFPSLYEGFGLPVVEAMACACPVVASDRGSLPEVVGEAGLLVAPEDASALAEALLRVLSDAELRSDLVRRGLEQVRSFSWCKAANETLAVYRRVAG
jgi:glycosyltransferase involved in cell wall biosynthesis